RPLIEANQTQLTTYHYGDPKHPGDLTSITDPNTKTWTLGYDTYGDVVTMIDPLGNKTTSTYNTIGWLLTRVSPKGYVKGNTPLQYTTSFSHDPFGRVTTVTDPLGHKSTWKYDADGNNSLFIDADGKK